MLRLSLASLLLLAFSGCYVGPKINNLPPVQTGQGIVVGLTTARVPQTSGLWHFSAEVLMVQEDGLLLRSLLVHESQSILRISYDVITEAKFDGLRRLNFGIDRPPSPDQQEDLRLLSRFPQGVSDGMLRRLLAAYNQDELRTIP